MNVGKTVLVVIIMTMVIQDCKPILRQWIRRRRRTRRVVTCSRRDCTVNAFSRWSPCSHQCGKSGIKIRTRSKAQRESCGGRCPFQMKETVACNRLCPNGGTPRNGWCSCRPGFGGNAAHRVSLAKTCRKFR